MRFLTIIEIVAWFVVGWMLSGVVVVLAAAIKHRHAERLRAEMAADPFPPLVITVLDGTILLKVHPLRCRLTWWRQRFVACSVSMPFNGRDPEISWHSDIKDTWSDAVWEARSHLLRMVWIERGMSPWEGPPA